MVIGTSPSLQDLIRGNTDDQQQKGVYRDGKHGHTVILDNPLANNRAEATRLPDMLAYIPPCRDKKLPLFLALEQEYAECQEEIKNQ